MLPPAQGSAPLGTSCGSPSLGCDPSDSRILVTSPSIRDQPFSSLITGLAGNADDSWFRCESQNVWWLFSPCCARLGAEAVSWQHWPPRPEEADSQPLCLRREVWMHREPGSRGASMSPKCYFEDPLFLRGGIETPEVGGGKAGLPGDPRYGGICSGGPGLDACCAPSPGPKAGRAARLSRGVQRPARLTPLHPQEFLPCWVFNQADWSSWGTQLSAGVDEPFLVPVGPAQDLGSPCLCRVMLLGSEVEVLVHRGSPWRSRNIWEVRGSLNRLWS